MALSTTSQASPAASVEASSPSPEYAGANSATCSSKSCSCDPPAVSPTTRNRSGFARTTSRAWVPTDPVDPRITTSRRSFTGPLSQRHAMPLRPAWLDPGTCDRARERCPLARWSAPRSRCRRVVSPRRTATSPPLQRREVAFPDVTQPPAPRAAGAARRRRTARSMAASSGDLLGHAPLRGVRRVGIQHLARGRVGAPGADHHAQSRSGSATVVAAHEPDPPLARTAPSRTTTTTTARPGRRRWSPLRRSVRSASAATTASAVVVEVDHDRDTRRHARGGAAPHRGRPPPRAAGRGSSCRRAGSSPRPAMIGASSSAKLTLVTMRRRLATSSPRPADSGMIAP